MPDPELQWIPDETAIPVRTRVLSAAVLAVSCVVIGIVIGRLTVGVPAGTGPGPSTAISAPLPKKPEPAVERPSLALKGDTETATRTPAVSPNPQAEPKTDAPPVVLLNPGTADNNPSAARQETRAMTQLRKERSSWGAPQQGRERQTTDDRRDILSRPAPDYHSLREYMLSR
jgi:hypothetical protein